VSCFLSEDLAFRTFRVAFSSVDRLVFSALYRLAPKVLTALTIVQPETTIRSHRAAFRAYLALEIATVAVPNGGIASLNRQRA
jgi:hypothetical protein